MSGYAEREQAAVKHWTDDAKVQDVAGIRLSIEPGQITITNAEGETGIYRARPAWRDHDCRYLELDCDGLPLVFEVSRVGETLIQLACENHELGNFAWNSA